MEVWNVRGCADRPAVPVVEVCHGRHVEVVAGGYCWC